jgi:Protein of unknown function, DUF547
MTGTITRRAVLGGLLVAAAPCSACAAPRPDPWQRWQASDETSTASIDHAAWDRFLARHLVAGADGINRVAYRRVLPAEREALAVYLAALAGLPVTTYRRAEQLAYWINLYNALTVRVVLDHYPVASIRDIALSGGLFSRGPWRKKLMRVEGEEVSLDDIEHRILRPFWRDPRLHYALNCAALGCPNLQPRAFTAATAEVILDQAARAYVNHPRGTGIVGERLYVSSIYVWYIDDFGGNDRGVIAHLRRYAAPPLAQALASQTSIAGDNYDWALNDATAL